jgi:hypothetical protein
MPGEGKNSPSDHFAARLSFPAVSPLRNRFKIPEWVAREDAFIDQAKLAINAHLQQSAGKNPAIQLLAAKRAIRVTAISFMSEMRHAATTKAAVITTGLNFLRQARSHPKPSQSHLQALASVNPGLSKTSTL